MNPLKTSKSYQNAIRNEYEKKKNILYDGQLISPSPGTLQQLILICYDKSTYQDKEVFNHFFALKPDKDAHRQIEEFGLDRLRPLRSFFMGTTKSPSRYIIELIAILIDFRPRPYSKYLDGEEHIQEPKSAKEELKKEILSPELDLHDSTVMEPRKQVVTITKIDRVIKWRLVLQVSLIIAGIILMYNVFFTDCNLMIWKNDHYEKVDCEMVNDDSIGTAYISLDETLLENMRKVKVDSLTNFFHKDGTPRIWYYKVSDSELECFTSPGLHPENKKTLKPMTEHMINKYVLKKDIHD